MTNNITTIATTAAAPPNPAPTYAAVCDLSWTVIG